MKWKKKQDRQHSPSRMFIIRMLTEEHSPFRYMEGRTISKERRVPVGRKLTSMEVLESVLWTPFATARLLRPVSGAGRGEEGGYGEASCGVAW